MTGEEIAIRTLNLEKVSEPCIITPWCMKREFFSNLTGEQNIYKTPVDTVISAFIKIGANLCPQLIMPSPLTEHLAVDPVELYDIFINAITKPKPKPAIKINSPEDVKNYIETLPDKKTIEINYDMDRVAEKYAKRIILLKEKVKTHILFISGFGQSNFMGPLSSWGYENYLAALALYPEHLKMYYEYTAEQGRLYNIAIVNAIKKHNLAPFVYGGQDICFNEGPMCSPDVLDKIYFPALKHAVEPLHTAGIKIIWHCDGDVRKIVNQLITEIGVSGFQGFQEDTGCTLEYISKLKTRNSKKPIIWGSVSVTTTLPFGTIQDVKSEVERCFKTASPGGGFALASTSSILPETPYENIVAMYKHATEFGKAFLS